MVVARRSRGEGSLFWNEKRHRWIGIVSQGYAANGKRRTTLARRDHILDKPKVGCIVRA